MFRCQTTCQYSVINASPYLLRVNSNWTRVIDMQQNMQQIRNKENIPHTNSNNKVISTKQIYVLNGCINKIGTGLLRPNCRAGLSRRKRTEQVSRGAKRIRHTKILQRTEHWSVRKPPRLKLSLAKQRVS